jgi:Flp pilus assembly protein TadG
MRVLPMGQFFSDERGSAMVFVAVMLPVLVGFALLAIDMSRANNLHNDLQKGVDALALAAAAELDGNTGAITRANAAVQNLIQNSTKFSDAGNHVIALTDVTVTYLTGIPASDSISLSAAGLGGDAKDYSTTTASAAVFAEVTLKPASPTAPFTAIFPASFLGGDNSFDISAQAVAGYSGSIACNTTPLFICNPFPGLTLSDVVTTQALYRKTIKLVAGGGNSQWGPGNFGFLRAQSDTHGANDLSGYIATAKLQECVRSNKIYTQPGSLNNKYQDAFNIRFDLYGTAGGFSKSDPAYGPAPNVRKGYDKDKGKPSACNVAASTQTSQFRKLTPDTTLPDDGGRLGTGMWDFEGYRDTNKLTSPMSGWKDAKGVLYSNANPPSRYDVYKYEIDHNLVSTASKGGETGTPACSTAAPGDYKRRLLVAALVDCSTSQPNGNTSMPAMGFASFFMTEPASATEIYAEIVDVAGTEGRGTMNLFARDDVQLYR